jgi:hypothetical protein
MSAELVPFVLDGRKLRHVLIDGIPWFFAYDFSRVTPCRICRICRISASGEKSRIIA